MSINLENLNSILKMTTQFSMRQVETNTKQHLPHTVIQNKFDMKCVVLHFFKLSKIMK